MATQEQLSQPELSSNQNRIRFDSDEGSIVLGEIFSALPIPDRLKKFAAGALLVGIVAGGAGSLGFFAGVKDEIHVDSQTRLDLGKAELTAVYPIAPNTCYGVYEDQVSGAKAEVPNNLSVFGMTIPTTLNVSSTFTGPITSEVCTTGVAGNLKKPDSNHAVVTIPAASFNTIVYPSDPTHSLVVTGGGLLTEAMNNFFNIAKLLPSVTSTPPDDINSFLSGQAQLAAFAVSTMSCGREAWPLLKNAYGKQVAQQIATLEGIPVANVTMILPDEIDFKDQFYSKEQQVMGSSIVKDGNLVISAPSDVACTKSPDLIAMENQLGRSGGQNGSGN